jgi:hypothetical protein
MISRLFLGFVLCLPLARYGLGSEKVRVFVYRYKQFYGSAISPSVYCDEVQMARMENGRYFVVTLPPGKHEFRSNDKQSGMELDAKEGQDYYIRVELAPGFAKGHGRLVATPLEQGSYEIRKLKPLDPDRIMGSARILSPASAGAENQRPIEARPLVNSDVTALKAAGMGDEVIIAKIRSTANQFSLATEDLIQLKKAEVSDAVITAMMESGKQK